MTPRAASIPVIVIVPPRALLLDIAGPIEVLRRANLEQHDVRFDVRYVGAVSRRLRARSASRCPASRLARCARRRCDGRRARQRRQRSRSARIRPMRDVARDEDAIVAWLARACRPSQHARIDLLGRAARRARRPARRPRMHDAFQLLRRARVARAARARARKPALRRRRQALQQRRRHGRHRPDAASRRGALSPAIALAVARHLVVYLRRSGADPQLSPWLEGRNHIHPAVHRAQDAIAADPSREWTLATLARIANTSARHLSRLFNEHAGMGLPDYINRLRVVARARAAAADAAGHGARRRAQRLRLCAPAPARVAQLLCDASACGARSGASCA